MIKPGFFLNLLTLIFVICKILEVGVIAQWSWWVVFAPTLVSMSSTLFIILGFIIAAIAHK